MKIEFLPEAKAELDDAIEEETILIIAIAHHHRNPNYWIDRI